MLDRFIRLLRCTRPGTIVPTGIIVLLIVLPAAVADEPVRDLRRVTADLVLPPVVSGPARAGHRVRMTDEVSQVAILVWLPVDWTAKEQYPLIVELPGNGGFRNALGDTCNGLPDECCLGYGITAGRGAIWVSVPFLTASGQAVAKTWWGDPPDYDVQPTADLLQRVVEQMCGEYGGDSTRVFLAGFSRGAIACGRIGLYDDQRASLWAGLICCSHYDGVRGWPDPRSGRTSARVRLERFAGRPQFVCHESEAPPRSSLRATESWLRELQLNSSVTFVETGFRNHNAGWVLRPCAARRQLRTWFWQHAEQSTGLTP